jgi:thymidylate kinase
VSVIILEGSDLTGKSTFADVLVDLLHRRGRSAFHLKTGPPEPDADPFVEYEQRLYPFLQEPGTATAILDRWHWGELIYGPVMRGGSRIDMNSGFRHIELFLASVGAIVVWLHQPAEVLIERYSRRGDDFVPDTQVLRQINNHYPLAAQHSILPVLALRDPTIEDACTALDVAADNDPYPGTRTFIQHPTYIGSQNPHYLLLGEKRGGQPPHHGDRSAFVPRSGNSGSFLLSALPEDMWPHVGIVNVCEDEDPGELDELWNLYDGPNLVALGRAAHRAATRAQLEHSVIPHPQFVRRFKHGERENYGRLIRAATNKTMDRLDWRGGPP